MRLQKAQKLGPLYRYFKSGVTIYPLFPYYNKNVPKNLDSGIQILMRKYMFDKGG